MLSQTPNQGLDVQEAKNPDPHGFGGENQGQAGNWRCNGSGSRRWFWGGTAAVAGGAG